MPENLLLDDLDIYQHALEIGECAWNIVLKWDNFSKRTVRRIENSFIITAGVHY